MRANNWVSKHKSKFKATTNSNHNYPVCRNLLNRNFNPSRLNETWVSDIIYIHTNQTIVPAWKKAVSKHKINIDLIFHSDRGIQYASKTFRTFIKSNPLVNQSMSGKGKCWGNSVAESFFKTIKTELIYDDDFKTVERAKTAVFEYIEIWYNRKQLHTFLGYKTP